MKFMPLALVVGMGTAFMLIALGVESLTLRVSIEMFVIGTVVWLEKRKQHG